MEKITGNKSLDSWTDFFKKDKKSMTRFIFLLKNNDNSCLASENTFDFDHPLFDQIPKLGFLESDLKKIIENFDKDGITCAEEKTRLIIAAYMGVNLKSWRKNYSEEINQVFEKSFLDGYYEKYNISLEKVIPIAIKTGLIQRGDFMAIALLRGVVLGNRYPENKQQKILFAEILANKFKIFFGF